MKEVFIKLLFLLAGTATGWGIGMAVRMVVQ